MNANVIRLPSQSGHDLKPASLEFYAREIAIAFGGTGVLHRGPSGFSVDRWYNCRCPLCGGALRVVNRGPYTAFFVDCAEGCQAEDVVEEIVRRGHASYHRTTRSRG